jgi:hypothetical protein
LGDLINRSNQNNYYSPNPHEESPNKLSYENSIADDYQPTFHIDLFKNAQPLETLSDFATT